jgi:hypothetical protein
MREKTKISFTEKELNDLKEIYSSKSFDFEKIEKIKELKGDDISLSKAFIESYDFLKLNLYQFDNKVLKTKIDSYLKEFEVSKLRELIDDYGKGEDIGSYIISERIKKIINSDRDKYIDLIKFLLIISGD